MSTATRIATPYAKSLLDLARERNEIDAVTMDIRHLVESSKNEDLRNLMSSPVISADKKQRVFESLFGGYHTITKSFIRIVTDKGRESALPEIGAAFMEIFRTERNISTVVVTSAAPLEASAIERIKAKLTAEGLASSNIELEERIDPTLIGGFVVQVGDRLYDASVKSQLATLRKGFSSNLYVNNLR